MLAVEFCGFLKSARHINTRSLLSFALYDSSAVTETEGARVTLTSTGPVPHSVVLSPHVPTAVHARIRTHTRTQILRGWPLATPARRQGSGESERPAPLTPRFLYTLVAEQEVLSSAAGSRPTIRALIAGLPVRDETLKTQGKVTCAGNYLYHFFTLRADFLSSTRWLRLWQVFVI